eukprot:1127126-Prymnesium_polylepis.2
MPLPLTAGDAKHSMSGTSGSGSVSLTAQKPACCMAGGELDPVRVAWRVVSSTRSRRGPGLVWSAPSFCMNSNLRLDAEKSSDPGSWAPASWAACFCR